MFVVRSGKLSRMPVVCREYLELKYRTETHLLHLRLEVCGKGKLGADDEKHPVLRSINLSVIISVNCRAKINMDGNLSYA
jgi:hypothetical protein